VPANVSPARGRERDLLAIGRAGGEGVSVSLTSLRRGPRTIRGRTAWFYFSTENTFTPTLEYSCLSSVPDFCWLIEPSRSRGRCYRPNRLITAQTRGTNAGPRVGMQTSSWKFNRLADDVA